MNKVHYLIEKGLFFINSICTLLAILSTEPSTGILLVWKNAFLSSKAMVSEAVI